MVRPVASDTNKAIALTFAAATTQITRDTDDIVARNGRCGLFSALRDVYPQTVRDEHSGVRDGVSEMEFNKTLQVPQAACSLLPIRDPHDDLRRSQDTSVSATAAQAQSVADPTPWDPASMSSVVSAGLIPTPKPTRS